MNNNIKMMEMQIDKIAKKKFEYWKEEFVKDIILEIENAQEDCANLEWITKDQAIRIIKIKSGIKYER